MSLLKYPAKLSFIVLLLLGLCQGVAVAQCDTVAQCSPGNATDPAAGAFGSGIRSVRFATLNYTAIGATEGYKNLYCGVPISIIRNRPYNFTVRTGPNFNENLRIYIDLNLDNSFDPNLEQVYAGAAISHSGSFTLPTSVPLGRKMRVRLVSDRTTNSNIGPCFTPQIGQGVDFSIIAIENSSPPTARFSVADSIVCSPTVSFFDESVNAPTQWRWFFGDGDSSTNQNPVHTYDRNGVYTIRLVVQNPFGTNTITKENFIVLNDTVAQANICSPSAATPCCGYTIANLRLLNINTTGLPNTSGYQDYSCRFRARMVPSGVYRITFNGSASEGQDTKVWLDANNDGEFSTAELIGSQTNATSHNVRIIVPSNALTGVPLRLRVGSDFTGSDFSACNGMIHGQYEDYTVIVSGFTTRPEADFEQLDTSLCQFTREFNFSGNVGGSSYQWFFGDGNTRTTTLPNVTHTYINPGTYNVELRVSNSFGSDTVVKPNAVRIFGSVPALNNCSPTIANASSSYGITRVRLGTLDYTSGAGTEGYRDNTCNRGAFLTPGVANVLTIFCPRSNPGFPSFVKVYIDWNNNGRFDNSETILNSQTTSGQITSNINPALTVLQNTPLRLRMVVSSNNTFNACSNLAQGEVEDIVVICKYPDRAPQARFGTTDRANCTGYFQFTDSSLYLPTTYRWTFGNNLGTSTQRNPNFTFSSPGTYSVKLVVTNAFGTDSLTRTDYVRVLQSNGLVASNCTPIATSPQATTGITNVNFLTVNNSTSDSREGYRDFACSQFATVTRGQTVSITISQQVNAGFIGVWADWNKDGNFSSSELVLQASSGINPFNGSFVIPQAARSGRTRLRISVDFNDLVDPCLNSFGQVEDYGLDIEASNRAPVAKFGYTNITCSALAQFADSSGFDPTSWLWNFGDNATSTLQNPSHTYSAEGNYTVSLIVNNTFGADTFVFPNPIRVRFNNSPLPIACSPNPTNATAFSISGIYNVTLKTINHNSNSAFEEGYVNNSCLYQTNLHPDTAYLLSVRTNTIFEESVMAWIDWNNNASFDNSERVLASTGLEHSINVQAPRNAVKSVPLRMRVRADQAGVIANACEAPFTGQIEDYAILVIDPANAKSEMLNSFSLYPNPASNQFKLQWQVGSFAGSNFKVLVTDVLGKTMITETVESGIGTKQMNIGNLKTGIYLVQVLVNGEQRTFKLNKL